MNGSKSKKPLKADTVGNQTTNQKEAERVAFALGGLSGNNSHGAGFLAAALDKGLKPVMISCTSGQIYWVYHYLLCLKAKEEKDTKQKDMRSIMKEQIDSAEPSSFQDLNFAQLALVGRPGIFEPAGPEYIADCWHNAAGAMGRVFVDLQRNQKPFLTRSLMDVPAARWLKPEFSDAFFEQIADALQDSDIGIAFNSYNPAEGYEHVYLNQKARELLKLKSEEESKNYEPGHESSVSDRRVYEDISPRAVRRGLWVYWYGFGEDGDPHLDGAYLRQIMLSELTFATTIYVVRPLHYHWSGEMPTSWTGLEDLKTKMNFNGTYMGERGQIELINKLVNDGKVSTAKYHPIQLNEIEMDRPRGFFGYAFEDIKVFDEAYAKSMVELPGPRPHPILAESAKAADVLASPQPAALAPMFSSADLMFKTADSLMQMSQRVAKALMMIPGA